MKLSRRQLAQSFAVGSLAGAAALKAQTPSAAQELDRAKASLRETAQSIRRVNLPMSVEPAVQFKAKV